MDVEAVHSVAPGASILLLYTNAGSESMNAIDYVASNRLATIVSNNWGYACSSGSCDDTRLPASLCFLGRRETHDGRFARIDNSIRVGRQRSKA